MSTRIPIILYRHLLKRRYLIALTLVTLLVGSNARSQTNNWQNSVISSESLYSTRAFVFNIRAEKHNQWTYSWLVKHSSQETF